MSANGRLLPSELAPIGGGYYLARSAASSFVAMSQDAQRRWGRSITVVSAYRTYAQQVWLWNNVLHAHDTNWVAYPGTSNHGWGLAVDLSATWCRWAVDQIGSYYGWAKRCSDAPVEWWHIKYNPGCTGAHYKPGPQPQPGPRVIRYGMRGNDVRNMQIWLVRGGWLKKRPAPCIDGVYGRNTHGALVLFQRKNRLAPDGAAGPQTIGLLRKLYGWPWPKKK